MIAELRDLLEQLLGVRRGEGGGLLVGGGGLRGRPGGGGVQVVPQYTYLKMIPMTWSQPKNGGVRSPQSQGVRRTGEGVLNGPSVACPPEPSNPGGMQPWWLRPDWVPVRDALDGAKVPPAPSRAPSVCSATVSLTATSMAFVTNSNCPQPLWHPPLTASIEPLLGPPLRAPPFQCIPGPGTTLISAI